MSNTFSPLLAFTNEIRRKIDLRLLALSKMKVEEL